MQEIALKLMNEIIAIEKPDSPSKEYLLSLYGECLNAVKGNYFPPSKKESAEVINFPVTVEP